MLRSSLYQIILQYNQALMIKIQVCLHPKSQKQWGKNWLHINMKLFVQQWSIIIIGFVYISFMQSIYLYKYKTI